MTAKATEILIKNIQGGTGTSANIGCPAGGKTGTTDNHTDAWFVGFTPNLATSVWVGFPESRIEMYPPTTPISVAGGTYPAQIWGAYMKQVKKGCGDFRAAEDAVHGRAVLRPLRLDRRAAPRPGPRPDGTAHRPRHRRRPTARRRPRRPTARTDGTPAYDPDLYETPPQPPPDADAAAGPRDGDATPGNGNGNGTGGITP